jgi:hypothetical protein
VPRRTPASPLRASVVLSAVHRPRSLPSFVVLPLRGGPVSFGLRSPSAGASDRARAHGGHPRGRRRGRDQHRLPAVGGRTSIPWRSVRRRVWPSVSARARARPQQLQLSSARGEIWQRRRRRRTGGQAKGSDARVAQSRARRSLSHLARALTDCLSSPLLGAGVGPLVGWSRFASQAVAGEPSARFGTRGSPERAQARKNTGTVHTTCMDLATVQSAGRIDLACAHTSRRRQHSKLLVDLSRWAGDPLLRCVGRAMRCYASTVDCLRTLGCEECRALFLVFLDAQNRQNESERDDERRLLESHFCTHARLLSLRLTALDIHS